MSNTKSNLDTLIASFLLPWKVTNQSTGKEQPNNHKKPCAWILPVLQCLQNPTGFITVPGKIFAKSQKAKKFSTFRIFRIVRIFRLFDFRIFRIFRLFEPKSPGMWTFRLFDFSRAKIVIFTVWPIPARRAHSFGSLSFRTRCTTLSNFEQCRVTSWSCRQGFSLSSAWTPQRTVEVARKKKPQTALLSTDFQRYCWLCRFFW